jgi:TM2 domain-containing membrane protein YozV
MSSGTDGNYGWPNADPGDGFPAGGPATAPAADAQARYQVQTQPSGPGLGYPQQVVPVVAPKNPGVSVLLSVFIPGLGSMINDNVGIGVAILSVYVVGLVLAIVLIGIPIAFGAWVWGMIDAYQSAQRWNLARGIIS